MYSIFLKKKFKKISIVNSESIEYIIWLYSDTLLDKRNVKLTTCREHPTQGPDDKGQAHGPCSRHHVLRGGENSGTWKWTLFSIKSVLRT